MRFKGDTNRQNYRRNDKPNNNDNHHSQEILASRLARFANSSSTSTEDINDDNNNYDMDNNGIIGTCMEMCPVNERKDRERDRDLSIFERIPGTGSGAPGDYPQVDHSKAVKKYKRAAAAKNVNPADVRPEPVLIQTAKYLIDEVLNRTDYPYHEVALFISDRFRALKKDYDCQGVKSLGRVLVLETIIRYHIINGYLLVDASLENYSQQQNTVAITGTLTSLLHLYEDGIVSENEAEFRAYFLMLSVNTDDFASRYASIDPKLRNHPYMSIVKAFQSRVKAGNYIQIWKLISQSPYLINCIFMVKLNELRCSWVSVIVSSFNRISTSDLGAIIRVSDEDAEVLAHARGYQVTNGIIANDKRVNAQYLRNLGYDPSKPNLTEAVAGIKQVVNGEDLYLPAPPLTRRLPIVDDTFGVTLRVVNDGEYNGQGIVKSGFVEWSDWKSLMIHVGNERSDMARGQWDINLSSVGSSVREHTGVSIGKRMTHTNQNNNSSFTSSKINTDLHKTPKNNTNTIQSIPPITSTTTSLPFSVRTEDNSVNEKHKSNEKTPNERIPTGNDIKVANIKTGLFNTNTDSSSFIAGFNPFSSGKSQMSSLVGTSTTVAPPPTRVMGKNRVKPDVKPDPKPDQQLTDISSINLHLPTNTITQKSTPVEPSTKQPKVIQTRKSQLNEDPKTILMRKLNNKNNDIIPQPSITTSNTTSSKTPLQIPHKARTTSITNTPALPFNLQDQHQHRETLLTPDQRMSHKLKILKDKLQKQRRLDISEMTRLGSLNSLKDRTLGAVKVGVDFSSVDKNKMKNITVDPNVDVKELALSASVLMRRKKLESLSLLSLPTTYLRLLSRLVTVQHEQRSAYHNEYVRQRDKWLAEEAEKKEREEKERIRLEKERMEKERLEEEKQRLLKLTELERLRNASLSEVCGVLEEVKTRTTMQQCISTISSHWKRLIDLNNLATQYFRHHTFSQWRKRLHDRLTEKFKSHVNIGQILHNQFTPQDVERWNLRYGRSQRKKEKIASSSSTQDGAILCTQTSAFDVINIATNNLFNMNALTYQDIVDAVLGVAKNVHIKYNVVVCVGDGNGQRGLASCRKLHSYWKTEHKDKEETIDEVVTRIMKETMNVSDVNSNTDINASMKKKLDFSFRNITYSSSPDLSLNTTSNPSALNTQSLLQLYSLLSSLNLIQHSPLSSLSSSLSTPSLTVKYQYRLNANPNESTLIEFSQPHFSLPEYENISGLGGVLPGIVQYHHHYTSPSQLNTVVKFPSNHDYDENSESNNSLFDKHDSSIVNSSINNQNTNNNIIILPLSSTLSLQTLSSLYQTLLPLQSSLSFSESSSDSSSLSLIVSDPIFTQAISLISLALAEDVEAYKNLRTLRKHAYDEYSSDEMSLLVFYSLSSSAILWLAQYQNSYSNSDSKKQSSLFDPSLFTQVLSVLVGYVICGGEMNTHTYSNTKISLSNRVFALPTHFKTHHHPSSFIKPSPTCHISKLTKLGISHGEMFIFSHMLSHGIEWCLRDTPYSGGCVKPNVVTLKRSSIPEYLNQTLTYYSQDHNSDLSFTDLMSDAHQFDHSYLAADNQHPQSVSFDHSEDVIYLSDDDVDGFDDNDDNNSYSSREKPFYSDHGDYISFDSDDDPSEETGNVSEYNTHSNYNQRNYDYEDQYNEGYVGGEGYNDDFQYNYSDYQGGYEGENGEYNNQDQYQYNNYDGFNNYEGEYQADYNMSYYNEGESEMYDNQYNQYQYSNEGEGEGDYSSYGQYSDNMYNNDYNNQRSYDENEGHPNNDDYDRYDPSNNHSSNSNQYSDQYMTIDDEPQDYFPHPSSHHNNYVDQDIGNYTNQDASSYIDQENQDNYGNQVSYVDQDYYDDEEDEEDGFDDIHDNYSLHKSKKPRVSYHPNQHHHNQQDQRDYNQQDQHDYNTNVHVGHQSYSPRSFSDPNASLLFPDSNYFLSLSTFGTSTLDHSYSTISQHQVYDSNPSQYASTQLSNRPVSHLHYNTPNTYTSTSPMDLNESYSSVTDSFSNIISVNTNFDQFDFNESFADYESLEIANLPSAPPSPSFSNSSLVYEPVTNTFSMDDSYVDAIDYDNLNVSYMKSPVNRRQSQQDSQFNNFNINDSYLDDFDTNLLNISSTTLHNVSNDGKEQILLKNSIPSLKSLLIAKQYDAFRSISQNYIPNSRVSRPPIQTSLTNLPNKSSTLLSNHPSIEKDGKKDEHEKIKSKKCNELTAKVTDEWTKTQMLLDKLSKCL